MNMVKVVGVLLIVAGLLGVVFSTFSFTKETHEAKLGPIELSVKEKQTVNIPVWASVAAIVVGGLLLVVGGSQGARALNRAVSEMLESGRLERLYTGLSLLVSAAADGRPARGLVSFGALGAMLDPDLHARGMMQTIDHPIRGPVTVPGWPLRMSDTKVPLKSAPVLGGDCEAIYGEWLGHTPDEVKEMRKAKVI